MTERGGEIFPLGDFRFSHYSPTAGFTSNEGVPFVRKLLIGLLIALAVTAFPAVAGARVSTNGPLQMDPNHKITQSQSSNWSGYAATGGGFTSVTSTWTQPAASCTSATTYSSFWVGLDGDGSNTVEQTGTSADCSGGSPRYYAWYEMYPKYPVNLSLAIRPGDVIIGSVTVTGNGRYTLHLHNNTTGGDFSTTVKGHGSNYSAEAIAEAPSSRSGVLPLTNFGAVNFSKTLVNGQPIGNFNYDRIDMVSGSTLKAQTSSLSGGTSFSVAWKHS
jgi:Peptidase A4 family